MPAARGSELPHDASRRGDRAASRVHAWDAGGGGRSGGGGAVSCGACADGAGAGPNLSDRAAAASWGAIARRGVTGRTHVAILRRNSYGNVSAREKPPPQRGSPLPSPRSVAGQEILEEPINRLIRFGSRIVPLPIGHTHSPLEPEHLVHRYRMIQRHPPPRPVLSAP